MVAPAVPRAGPRKSPRPLAATSERGGEQQRDQAYRASAECANSPNAETRKPVGYRSASAITNSSAHVSGFDVSNDSSSSSDTVWSRFVSMTGSRNGAFSLR